MKETKVPALRGVHTANPLGIGGKLTLGFGILGGLTVLVVGLGFIADRSATADIDLTEALRGPASRTSAEAQASLLNMQLHVRGYLVLSDPQDVEQYRVSKTAFERSLASLKAMSVGWSDDEDAQRVARLTATYERWVALPQQLFELHDNPFKNRPALRLARIEVQPRRVQIMNEIDAMIGIQKAREPSRQNRELLAELVNFQTSYDAMATNLLAYAASGQLNFKLAYGPQLATNAAIWATLSAKRAFLTAEQRASLDAIARHRAEVAELALQIVNVITGEHAYEDLYLYRTEVAPQAEAMLTLLGEVTAHQQAQLQTDLGRARDSLASAHLQTVAGGLLAVGLSVAMAFLFGRRIVGPVRRLTAVAERVAAGDLSARAKVESRDEIGLLATTINTMTQRLAETIDHLETVFAEAQRAQGAAEVANQAKSAFLASMSHELRTPLNAVLGYAQILKRDGGLSKREATSLNIIQQSGEQLLTLINDILDLSRIEAGKLELYSSVVNLPAFLRMIADTIRIKAEERSLSFTFEASPDLPRAVRADEKRLRQVLLNLLGNAVKFTDRGEVSLRVLRLGGRNGQARLRFEVEDTGIGIAENQLETMFQPFEQVGDVQHRFGGTGLGLAISRQLIRLMASDIHVESRVAQGSRFWFDVDLPVEAAGVETAPLTRIVTGYQGPRKKVLVVDDVRENRAVVVDLLAPLGFEMYEAVNGQEGLDIAQTLRPDLILMDNVMPVMDGLDAMRRLRQVPVLETMPVIALSASASALDQQKSLSVGANAFLTKPIDFNRLLQEIESLLHLTWVVEPPEEAAAALAESVGPLIAPPPEEMEILHRLAMTGNMRDIRERADGLAALDERYRPFADKLRRLAEAYQSQAILGVVEAHMQRKTDSHEHEPGV